jgi:hypothetical protein
MSDPWVFVSSRRRSRQLVVLALGLGLATLQAGPSARADDEQKSKAVGSCVSEAASILRRPAGEQSWHAVADKETVNSGDLLVGLPGSMIDSANGAVRLTLMADLDRSSPYPILECAVQPHQASGVDLDFTLDRGRVEVENRKQSGAAHVRLHIRNDTWDLNLTEPGAALGIELYGRWPRGATFQTEPDPKQAPTASMVLLVLKGEVILKHKHHEHTLSAPPGPAMIEWDSVAGQDEAPERLDKLPAWALTAAADSAVAKQKKVVLERFRQALLNKSVGEAIDEFINSEQPGDRRLAVILMGAIDDLPRLGRAMRETKHPDVWEDGVLALRHWIGRCPGQDLILYKKLIEVGNYKPVQAETLVQLLHSYGDEDLARPETYQTLIDYLNHDVPGIRGLAYWHLVRLVPAGRSIAYSPTAPKDEREAAVRKWRALVPSGQVPPRNHATTKQP